jgi:hypothetical protein
MRDRSDSARRAGIIRGIEISPVSNSFRLVAASAFLASVNESWTNAKNKETESEVRQ